MKIRLFSSKYKKTRQHYKIEIMLDRKYLNTINCVLGYIQKQCI